VSCFRSCVEPRPKVVLIIITGCEYRRRTVWEGNQWEGEDEGEGIRG
jgi:hypothetical protein